MPHNQVRYMLLNMFRQHCEVNFRDNLFKFSLFFYLCLLKQFEGPQIVLHPVGLLFSG